jgi:hypothetical protein
MSKITLWNRFLIFVHVIDGSVVAFLESILRNRFGRNLQIKPTNLVKFKFASITFKKVFKYPKIQDYCP